MSGPAPTGATSIERDFMRVVPTLGLALSGLLCSTSVLACDTVLAADVYVIDAPGKYCLNANRDHPLTIDASDVELDCKTRTISRGDQQNGHIGIEVRRHDNVTVRNCRVDGYPVGIEMLIERNGQLINNTVSNAGQPIFVSGSRDPQGSRLTGNRVVGYERQGHEVPAWTPAIEVWDLPKSQLINNVVVGYRGNRGILMMRSPESQLTGNQMLDFLAEADGVISMQESPRTRLVHNTIALQTVRGRSAVSSDTNDHTCVENIVVNAMGGGFEICGVSRFNVVQPWIEPH
ncbi:hypothetical protein ASD69_04760 [Lysobacter sp. Root604]|nr:hypothetical protein ASD69_04760 [Lysobacter sp. Root604]